MRIARWARKVRTVVSVVWMKLGMMLFVMDNKSVVVEDVLRIIYVVLEYWRMVDGCGKCDPSSEGERLFI